MTRRWTWWLAWGIWFASVTLFAAGVALQETVGNPAAGEQDPWPVKIVWLTAFVGFATVGALVASRQTRNAVGWIFAATALLLAVQLFCGEYATYGFVTEPGSLPGSLIAGWLFLWTWYPAGALIVSLPLLFPDGRVPGPRWRPVLWFLAGFILVSTVLVSLVSGPINGDGEPTWPDNPLGVEALDRDTAEGIVTLAFLVPLAAAVASMVVRFRRSRGDERRQLKWMTYAVVVLALAVAIPETFGSDLIEFTFPAALALLPAAVAVAMFKYRLYDVDRLISRSLTYAVVTAVLVATYAGLVLAGQAIFSSLAGGSDLAIAVSTLVVAALFLPVRARVQRFVDRRFYRRRYDAQRTLEAFGARLRQQVDLPTLANDLEAVVEATVQPAHISLWRRRTTP